MSSSKSSAATTAARQYGQMATEARGIGRPALEARNAALMPALRQSMYGQLPAYLEQAFDVQRTGLQEGIANQERGAIQKQDLGAKGAVAGGNAFSLMSPAQFGAILGDAMMGSRVQQGMATVNQANNLMNMGLGGAAQTGNAAVGAAGQNLQAISMLPNYNPTYAGIMGAANLAGTAYGAWKQGNQTGIPDFNQNAPVLDMRTRGY